MAGLKRQLSSKQANSSAWVWCKRHIFGWSGLSFKSTRLWQQQLSRLNATCELRLQTEQILADDTITECKDAW